MKATNLWGVAAKLGLRYEVELAPNQPYQSSFQHLHLSQDKIYFTILTLSNVLLCGIILHDVKEATSPDVDIETVYHKPGIIIKS